MEIKNITACVDFSIITPAVLEWAGEEAKKFAAALELVHVLEETMPRLAQEMLDLHTLYDKLREVTQVRLGDLAHDLKKRFGIKVITTTLNGEPFDAILDHLENTKPDLVVVGAHGKKGVKRMLLGSVSEKVARKCNITVTIVKTG
jgi:nucleotide-binding universal stress UspA family protein